MANFVGTSDNETFNGNGDNDTATGNGGTDVLNGNDGDDVLYSNEPTGYYNRPYYGNPYTIPVLDRTGEADTLVGGDGNDFLSAGYGDNVDGGAGSDSLVISFQGATAGVVFNLNLTSQVIGGATIQNVESGIWTEGSEYNDTLTDNDVFSNFAPIFGMGGDDILVGGYYTGSLFGGDGNDTLDGRLSGYGFPQYGGAGNDTYLGGGQAVELADEGTDTIVSAYTAALGANIENLTLTGSYTADGVGNELDNVLTGNDGNNYLSGGAGNDTITGGADTGNGETTGDIAVYSGNRADYQATEDAGTHLVTIVDLRGASPDGTDTLDHTIELVQFADGTMTLADLVAGVAPIPNNFVGGDGNDTYAGNGNNNTAVGKGGDDELNGKAGNDTLEGDAGADTLDGGTGDDVLYSDVALGTVYDNPALDRGTDADTLSGGDGSDVISSGYGDNVDGGDGIDTLYISFQGATSGVTFDLRLSSQVVGGVTIQSVETAGVIEGSAYDDTITDGNFSPSAGFTTIFGMGGNDNLIATYFTGNLYGGDGNDVVDGRNSQYLDVVDGGAGNDTLYTNANTFAVAAGGDGDDLIYAHGEINGDAGNDTIFVQQSYYAGHVHGDDGNDNIDASTAWSAMLYGDDGNDTLTGGDSDDWLEGGAGDDTISGGADGGIVGDRVIYTGNVADYLATEDADTHLITIVDLRDGSPDGTDTLDHTIEMVVFADGSYSLEDLLLPGGIAPNNFVGDGSNDSYAGNAGDNTAVGNGGDDALNGQGGNDTLEGDSGTDTLNGGAGSDTLYSDAPTGYYNRPYFGNPYTVPVLDRTSEADMLTGGDGNDFLSAGYGDNVDGGAGTDLLVISFQGAAAGVVFDLNLTSQVIGGATIQNVEAANWIEGSEYDDTLIDNGGDGYNLFGPIFGMGGDDILVGGYYTGSLFGGDGNDKLDSSLSIYGFPMYGGAGDDTYLGGGQAVELDGEGTDTVVSYTTTTLGANIENLTLTGAYAADGTGNALNNVLTGNDGDNLLTGGAGNDTLTGGADQGDGETTGDIAVYSGNRADYLATEDAGTHLVTIVDLRGASPDGTDTLDHTIELVQFADGAVTLADLLSGVAPVPDSFVGGDGNDSYAGNGNNNTAAGKGGDDVLSGKAGSDTLEGDSGSDTLDGGAGEDILYSDAPTGYYNRPYFGNPYTVPVLDRTAEADTLAGGDGDDLLSAGYGDNVDGGAGSDFLLISFQGASAGVVFNLNLSSQVIGGGTIKNVESILWLEGSEYNDTLIDNGGTPYSNFAPIFGMGGDDILVSGYYTGSLFGGEGNDKLDGRLSAYGFPQYGGAGDDTYLGGGQAVELAGEGTDTVISAYTTTLGANIENLSLTGGNAVDGTGNELDNVLTGNDGNNQLYGLAGNDRLSGGAGNDTLSGGLGNDTYLISDTYDAIVEAGGEGVDLVRSSISYTLGGHVENLTLTGTAAIDGTGNDLDNVLIGNAGNNRLTGGAGDDRILGRGGEDIMRGGAGNDIYFVDSAGDKVRETADQGTDLVISSVKYYLGANVENLTLTGSATLGTGNELNNILRGNDIGNRLDGGAGDDILFGGDGGDVLWGGLGNDKLIGGLGKDTMFGGTGNDSYWVEAGDQIRETAGDGTDTVYASTSFRLSAGQSLENLVLLGTVADGAGNELDNRLYGNDGNNRLDGGLGADIMAGKGGDDTYYVDNAGDRVGELADDGTDTVVASVSQVLARFVENLVLTGTDDLKGTGNALDNRLIGNSGANLLNGGAGADIMAGGAGNDSYIVDNAGDRVGELAGGGTDVVYSSVSYNLRDAVENLILKGSDNISAGGNALDNLIRGNTGDNRINGGGGDDELFGYGGADTFIFGAGSGADRIHDFKAVDGDWIHLRAYSEKVPYGGGITITQEAGFVLIDMGDGNSIEVLGAHKADVVSHIIW